jgi:hypothetical protein
MYDEYAPRAISMGYHTLPISPPGFKPDKTPVIRALTGKFIKYRGWNTDKAPVRTPQPGAGIGIRCGDNGVVAIDCDDDQAAPAIMAMFPTPVYKVGQRGGTGFYRAEPEIPSENYYDSTGRLILQILSGGRQTVIPPSIHPNTGKPYSWINGHSVYDTPVSDLPLLPPDYREQLQKLGYGPKPRTKPGGETVDPETGEINEFDGDSPHAELNAVALKHLDKWVMNLDIHKLHKQCGRYPSYRGVAQWRASTTGKALEERDTNLSICGSGIKDFGDDRGYSALDLVMAARACNLAEAFCWLEEKLLPQKPNIEIDLDKIIAAQESPSIVADEDPAADPAADPSDDSSADPAGDKTDYPELEKDMEIVGALWLLSDPLPKPKPMTVPYFVPSRSEPCIGYIGAATGSVKTFVADDLAIAISSKALFAGQQVTEPGAVVLIEMEGSSRTRLRASVQYRGAEGQNLPVIHIQKMPPPILFKGAVSREWRDWCVRTVRLVRWRMRREGWNAPLTAIILDPLAHFSGLTDIGSFTENTAVSKALIDLALAAKCLVIVVDHYGRIRPEDWSVRSRASRWPISC